MNISKPVDSIGGIQFVDLQPTDINPLMSWTTVKVAYVGDNRNGSNFTKEVLTKMSKTLRGAPLVAAYRKDVEDFGDHGQVMTIEDGEIHFNCKTRPYGFVPPNADVWFQKFNDYDKLGHTVEHEYLMTNAYLWTGQYEELEDVIANGRPQSMEIDDVKGDWSYDAEKDIEIFIVNDAVFTKLCILGNDVEPCFEGASVVCEFTDNRDNFTRSLFSMMSELKFALEGGLNMENEEVETVEAAEEEVVEQEVEETEEPAVEEETEEVVEDEPETEAEVAPEAEVEEEFEAAEEETSEEVEAPAEAYSALVAEIETLKERLASAERERDELFAFKAQVQEAEKDTLINKYYMLSDEAKADVVAHKNEYSLDEIDAKLALAYVRENVNFNAAEEEEEDVEAPATTFSLEDPVDEAFVDPILSAFRSMKQEFVI